MKKVLFLLSIVGIIGVLVSCSSAAETEKPVIEPAEGKLTFAFFYTDG